MNLGYIILTVSVVYFLWQKKFCYMSFNDNLSYKCTENDTSVKLTLCCCHTYFAFLFTSEFWFEQFQQNSATMKKFMNALMLLAFVAEINAGKVYRPIKICHTTRRMICFCSPVTILNTELFPFSVVRQSIV